MFARNAERMIILSDAGLGLLNRLHCLLTFRRPAAVFPADVDKFSRGLHTRRFPELPTDLPKASGFEGFRRHADVIRASLLDYVETLVDGLRWAEDSWQTLELLNNSMADFSLAMTGNADLSHYYFTLMLRYAQLHLMIAQLDSPQHNICAYYYASYVLSANAAALSSTQSQTITVAVSSLSPDYAKLAAHLNRHGKSPLRTLQADFTSLSVSIGNALCSASFSSPVFTFSKLKSYSDLKLFTLDASNTLLTQATEAKYAELLTVDRVRQYVLYGFLLCPGELSRPGALELLKAVLQHDVVVPLHRDVPLLFGREYGELFDSYTKGKFTLKKHKKTLKEATGDQHSVLVFHAELRILLQQYGAVWLHLMRDNPHALPVKLNAVLALVHAMRDEVVWYVRHLGLHVLQKITKEREKTLFDDHVSPLVFYSTAMLALVDRSRDDIAAYYLQFMQGMDSDMLLAAAASLPQLDPLCKQLLDNICNSLQSGSVNHSFEPLRLNWCRVSSCLSSAHAGVSAPVQSQLNSVMNSVTAHSRHVDALDSELKAHGTFSALYWHRDETLACFKRCLASRESQPAYALSYVKTLHSALHNVHRLCPEELPDIGREIVSTADSWLRLLTAAVEEAADFINKETTVLRQQTCSSQLITRVSGGKGAAVLQPGYESVWENRRALAGLRMSRDCVSDVLSSVEDEDGEGIVVFNVRVYAREYLLDMIALHLKRRLKQACFDGQLMQKSAAAAAAARHPTSVRTLTLMPCLPPASATRPAVILNRWTDMLRTFQTFERQLSFSLSDLAHDTLLQEFAAEDESGVEEKDDRPSIHAIAAWYSSVLSRDLAEIGIVYSPLQQAFVTRSGFTPSSHNQAAFIADFQRFTDRNALVSLVSLIGPAGVRIVFAAVMKAAQQKLRSVKELLQTNASVARAMTRRFSDPAAVAEAVSQVRDMDLLVALTTSVGALLHFRQLVCLALREVVGEHVPFIGATLSLASEVAHRSSKCDASLTVLDLLSADCGVDLGEADHLCRHIMSKLKTSVADVALFSLLPELFALSLSSSRCRSAQCQYQLDLQGHTNNLHCAALAIRHLLVDLNRIGVTASKEAEATVDARIQSDFERWLSCSAAVVLSVYAPGSSIGLGEKGGLVTMRDVAVGRQAVEVINSRIGAEVGGVGSVLMFLDVMVRESGGRLSFGLLEQCLPYTLLRETYCQLDERQNPLIVSQAQGMEEEKE